MRSLVVLRCLELFVTHATHATSQKALKKAKNHESLENEVLSVPPNFIMFGYHVLPLARL